MKIRKLKPCAEDFNALADLIRNHFVPEHQMGSLSAKKYDAVKSASRLAECIDCGAWVIEDDEAGVVGSIGLYPTTPWYSNETYLADGWLYVRPEFRKNHAGGMLVNEAIQFAKKMQVPLIIGIFNMDDVEAKVKAFSRMGLKLIGGSFIAGE